MAVVLKLGAQSFTALLKTDLLQKVNAYFNEVIHAFVCCENLTTLGKILQFLNTFLKN